LQAVEDFPSIQFSLAGDGPLRPEVEQAAARFPNLEYLGWLSRSGLRKTLDENDALLLPSHFETFGTIALEAMAREKLVFVSSGCGITHWDRLLPGLIVIDESGLTRSIESVLRKTPEERRDIARNGNSLAIAWNEDVMNRWYHILKTIVRDHNEQLP
jgi:glycosyltransferase involved in cell wall biosynthesis